MGRALKPEDWIAHYRVVSLLGAGGMGEVYRVRDQSLDRDVALKVLPSEVVTSEERVRRFTKEARSASSLNHPHIVHIYEIGEDQVRGAEPHSAPLHYIAMELVQGETLSAKIQDKRIELKTLLGWLAQAAEGVAKAHAAGIVHRDLKPSNIMVSDDGYAKVLDFGLAKLMEKTSKPGMSTAPTMTAEPTREGIVGTVGYMAPEQIRGQSVDSRADVFAFGCMLYEAATRQRPFVADSNVETLHRILHDVPEPVEARNPKVPLKLRRLIRRCLAKDPSHRPQSMRDLALELREIVDVHPEPSPGSGVMTLASGRFPSNVVLVSLSLSAAVLAAVFFLVSQGPPRLNPNRRTRNLYVPMRSIGYPGFSQDGHWIALPALDARGVWGLYWMNSAGSEIRPLAVDSTVGVEEANISPDGSQIADTANNTTGSYTDVRVVSALGGSPKTIARYGQALGWNPDGRTIGYVFQRGGSRPEFWTVRADGTEGRRVFVDSLSSPPGVSYVPRGFSWSPDGTRIAWLRAFAHGTYNEIVIHDMATGHERKLTKDQKIIGEVTWTTRNEIVFSSNRGGARNLWMMRASGGKPIQVTQGGGQDGGLRLSADGRFLLYQVWQPLSEAGWWDVETGEHGRLTRDAEPLAVP